MVDYEFRVGGIVDYQYGRLKWVTNMNFLVITETKRKDTSQKTYTHKNVECPSL